MEKKCHIEVPRDTPNRLSRRLSAAIARVPLASRAWARMVLLSVLGLLYTLAPDSHTPPFMAHRAHAATSTLNFAISESATPRLAAAPKKQKAKPSPRHRASRARSPQASGKGRKATAKTKAKPKAKSKSKDKASRGRIASASRRFTPGIMSGGLVGLLALALLWYHRRRSLSESLPLHAVPAPGPRLRPIGPLPLRLIRRPKTPEWQEQAAARTDLARASSVAAPSGFASPMHPEIVPGFDEDDPRAIAAEIDALTTESSLKTKESTKGHDQPSSGTGAPLRTEEIRVLDKDAPTQDAAPLPPRVAVHFAPLAGEVAVCTFAFRSGTEKGILTVTNQRLLAVYERYVLCGLPPTLEMEVRRNQHALSTIRLCEPAKGRREIFLYGALLSALWFPYGTLAASLLIAAYFLVTRPELLLGTDSTRRRFPLPLAKQGAVIQAISKGRAALEAATPVPAASSSRDQRAAG